jgi:hypothetical protein
MRRRDLITQTVGGPRQQQLRRSYKESLAILAEVQLPALVVSDVVNGLIDVLQALPQGRPGIGRQEEYADTSVGEVMLEVHVSIGGDQ